MNGLIIAGYGVYLISITLSGNADKLKHLVSQDGGKFVPWIVAVFVLSALRESDTTKPLVNPFITLFLIALVVKQFPKIKLEITNVYNHYVHEEPWK